MKTIVSAILLVLLLISVFMGAFNVQSAKANASSLGETVQAADTDWWPMFHHDLNHTGTSTSTAPTTNNTLWNYTTGGYVESSPAVVGGLVYAGSWDNNTYCLNAANGSLVWNYTTGGYVGSSPAVAGGRVYVGSFDNSTYCLNATTGTLVWNYTTGGFVISSPSMVDGVVYVGSYDDRIYAFGPPPLAVSISPASVTMDAGQSQTFNSTVSGGTSPYAYQWCLNGTAFLGAVGSSWNFTSPSTGYYTVYVNVTDSVGAVATSNTAAVTASPVTPEFPSYLILPLFMMATLLAAFVLKRKRNVRTQQARAR